MGSGCVSSSHRTSSLRARVGALTVVACAALACGTASVAGRPGITTAPAARTAPRAAPPRESGPAPTVFGPTTDGADPVSETVASVVVMPSGSAYLVLRAGPERRGGVLTWEVVYLAGDGARTLTQPEVQGWLGRAAGELVEAFAPMAEVGGLEHLSVTAVFGAPGGVGAVERRGFTRDGTGWHVASAPPERGDGRVPPVRLDIVRDPEAEVSARAAAASFIRDADRADYDAAWARTSALVKAKTSRAEFERCLETRPAADPGRVGDLTVSFYSPLEPFLPGSTMLAWVGRSTSTGPTLELLSLRLDDDMEWRVAGEAAWSAQPPPSAATREGPVTGVAAEVL